MVITDSGAGIGVSATVADACDILLVMTQLTEQQRQALQEHPGSPLEVVDSVTRSTYVLLPSEAYMRVRALLEEDELHPEELAPLMDEVAVKEGWADPAMGAYDALDPRRKP